MIGRARGAKLITAPPAMPPLAGGTSRDLSGARRPVRQMASPPGQGGALCHHKANSNPNTCLQGEQTKTNTKPDIQIHNTHFIVYFKLSDAMQTHGRGSYGILEVEG